MIKCKICGSKNIEIICVNKKKYYNCNECNFIFLDKKNFISKIDEKNRYMSHNNSIENSGYVLMFEDLINKSIIPYKKNIKTILDYGCGYDPVLSKLLISKGFSCDYYDIYFFKKINKNKKYDLIVSTETFEHFKNPILEIKKILSLLNERGYISIMTNFISNSEFKDWWYITDKTHISFYSKKTFQKICDIFNLEMLFCDNKKIVVLRKKNNYFILLNNYYSNKKNKKLINAKINSWIFCADILIKFF